MVPTQNQRRILQQIQEGSRGTREISEKLDLSLSSTNYLMEELDKQGYIKGPRIAFKGKRIFGSAALTDKGETALDCPQDLIDNSSQKANSVKFVVDSINAPISVLQGTVNEGDIQTSQSSSVTNEISEILNKIDALRQGISGFPDSEQEEAHLYLDELREEVQKQAIEPKKIRARFNSFLRVALPVANLIVGGTDFLNNLTDLAEKFDIALSPQQIEIFQQGADPSVTSKFTLPNKLE